MKVYERTNLDLCMLTIKMPIAPDILSFCNLQNNDNESITLQDFAENMFHFLWQTDVKN